MGGYLSVRTLLSHSVMIKALPGTPYRTHSQPTSQLDRNCSAMQPVLHTAHTGSHSLTHAHTHTYTYTHTCTLLLSRFVSFIPAVPYSFLFFFTSCCVFLRRFSSFSFQLKVLFNVSPLVVPVSSPAGSPHSYFAFFVISSCCFTVPFFKNSFLLRSLCCQSQCLRLSALLLC